MSTRKLPTRSRAGMEAINLYWPTVRKRNKARKAAKQAAYLARTGQTAEQHKATVARRKESRNAS